MHSAGVRLGPHDSGNGCAATRRLVMHVTASRAIRGRSTPDGVRSATAVPSHVRAIEAFSDIMNGMYDLEINHVSKRYRVRADRSAAARDSGNALTRTLQKLRPRSEEFWALRDVDIQVKRGEALGII